MSNFTTSFLEITNQEKIIEELQTQEIKHNKYNKIYNALEKCLDRTNLSPSLRNKVHNILLSNSSNLLSFGSEESDFVTILDLKLPEPTALTFLEQRELEMAVKSELALEKTLTNRSSSDTLPSVNSDALFKYKDQLNDQLNKYIQNLVKEQELLRQKVLLKDATNQKVLTQAHQELDLVSSMLTLKSDIIEQKAQMDIFTDTKHFRNAYNECLQHIKGEQVRIQHEIEALKQLREQYNAVKGPQFNALLKTFVEYTSAIEKKRLLYDNLFGVK